MRLPQKKRPNILFAISDDQSYDHTGFSGSGFVKTPAFDRIAKEGVFFSNCIAGSPGCAPSRSSIVTGRYPWQNEQSGQHASSWMKAYVPFVDLLAGNGYYTGYTGKGVDPFQYARDEKDSLWREQNAAGKSFNAIRYKAGDISDIRPAKGISNINYFENFRDFLDKKKDGQPFFFWYGAMEPHRGFEKDSWVRNKKELRDVKVPAFLPDNGIVRGDLLDYAVEIEWFDFHLQKMLEYLKEKGELENTIVIVTSDNGMAFPRAKANGYEYGVHVPFAVRFPKMFPEGRIIDDPVSFVDIAPTILELTGTSSKEMKAMTGTSILGILKEKKQGVVDTTRKYVYSGRERHSASRYLNRGYPQRVIRSKEFLLVWNMKPRRWPAGDPQRIDPADKSKLLPKYGIDDKGVYHSEWAFTDIDNSPTKSFTVAHKDEKEVHRFFEWATARRPEFELYQISSDPGCLKNLYNERMYTTIQGQLKKALMEELIKTKDPRVAGPDPEIFDSYERYSGPMREFPDSGSD
ncbi:sulfatase [Niabella sp. 3A5MI-3]|nr:sulfatase [Niabella beijingensis]